MEFLSFCMAFKKGKATKDSCEWIRLNRLCVQKIASHFPSACCIHVSHYVFTTVVVRPFVCMFVSYGGAEGENN